MIKQGGLHFVVKQGKYADVRPMTTWNLGMNESHILDVSCSYKNDIILVVYMHL